MNFEMNATLGAILGIIIILALIVGIGLLQRRPKVLKKAYFEKRWKELQTNCRSKNTWALAVINADKLLDEALRKRRFKGKAMGERLVTAQHILTDNDGVWFSHKLRNRLVHEDDVKLKEKDVKQALLGFRRALKDLGAL
jgi:hypothetical protein